MTDNINVDLINMFKKNAKKEGNDLPSSHPLNNYKINYDELFMDADEEINYDNVLEEDEVVVEDENEDSQEENVKTESEVVETKVLKKKKSNNSSINEKEQRLVFEKRENHKKRTMKGYVEIQNRLNNVIKTNRDMLIFVNKFNQTLTSEDQYVREKTMYLERLLLQTLDQINRLQLQRNK